jgi:hypothetical protein
MVELALILWRQQRSQEGFAQESTDSAVARDAQGAAGIAHPISWHDLRHLFVTLLIAAGKHPKYIAAAARHRDPGFSLRTYSHLFDSMPITTRSGGTIYCGLLAVLMFLSQNKGRSSNPQYPGSGRGNTIPYRLAAALRRSLTLSKSFRPCMEAHPAFSCFTSWSVRKGDRIASLCSNEVFRSRQYRFQQQAR